MSETSHRDVEDGEDTLDAFTLHVIFCKRDAEEIGLERESP